MDNAVYTSSRSMKENGIFSLRSSTTSARAVGYVQLGLNVVLLATGLWLAVSGIRLAVFLIAMVPLAFVPFSYARLRWHRFVETHVPSWFVWTLCALGASFDAIMVLQLLSARQVEPTGILQFAGVVWIGTVWFSAHAFLLLGYGLMGLARLGAKPVRRVLPKRREQPSDVDLGRRELLQKAGLFGAALPFGVSLSGVPVSYDFRVERRDITLPAWPSVLNGLRIVHLSDIHVGGMMDRARLLHVAELTNECKPDLVLHTGDFLTHRLGDFDAPLYEALARIRAPYGQWACLGNHDFDNATRLVQRLSDCGVTTLRDQRVSIPLRGTMLELAGIDFVFARSQRASIYGQIVSTWSPRSAAPRILLNHDPAGFVQLPDGCADLVLSGHTHGGHIGIQLSSTQAITVVGMMGVPEQGLFHRPDMSMYVTRCVGFYGYPMRIGIPPEIALLVLKGPEREARAELQSGTA